MRFIFYIFVGFLLAGCAETDIRLSQQSVGIWTRPAELPLSSDGFTSWKMRPPYRLSLLPNGTCLASIGNSKHNGRWVIRNATLVLTFTNSIENDVDVFNDKIIHIDDHLLIYAATNGEKGYLKTMNCCFGRLNYVSVQPARFSRLMNGAASGQFFARRCSPSHSMRLPMRNETQPSSMISASCPPMAKRE